MKSTADHLAEIPELAVEAWNTTGTKAVAADSAGSRTVPSSRCLADLDRLVALSPEHADGLGVLSTWVRHVADEMEEAGHPHDWPADNVAAACRWLASALPWCRGRGWEEELAEDVRRLWGSLRHICGRVEPKPLPCLTHGCPGTLSEVDGMLQCQIGHRHDGLRKWRHHPSMPIPAAAAEFHIPERTLRHWASTSRVNVDEGKGKKPLHVWPWDVLREIHPETVAAIEAAEKEKVERARGAA